MKINEDPRNITVSQTNLAKGLGLSINRIGQLISEGIVIRDDDDARGAVFLLQSVRNYERYKAGGKNAANNEDDVDINRERALREAAERKIAELKLAKMESRAYDARTVELVMTEQLSNLRTQLLGLPTKLAPILAEKSRDEIYEILTAEIKEKLAELSEYSPAMFADEEYLEAERDDETGK